MLKSARDLHFTALDIAHDMKKPFVRVHNARGRMIAAARCRSALEFVPQLVATSNEPAAHAYVLQALAVAARKANAALLDALLDGFNLEPPKGLPKSHWWWWLYKI